MNWHGAHQRASPRVPWQGLHPRHSGHGVGDPGQPRCQCLGRGDSPELSHTRPEDVQAAIAYTADLARERVIPLVPGAV
jgi:hypothetical protein